MGGKMVCIKKYCMALLVTAVALQGMEQPPAAKEDNPHMLLYVSILGNNAGRTRELLTVGINPNVPVFIKRLNESILPITAAAYIFNSSMIKLLFEFNADPSLDPNLLCKVYSKVDEGFIKQHGPLIFRNLKVSSLKLLIAHPKTNLNCVDENGSTPFIDALAKKDQELIQEFLKPEVFARIDKTITNKQGQTIYSFGDLPKVESKRRKSQPDVARTQSPAKAARAESSAMEIAFGSVRVPINDQLAFALVHKNNADIDRLLPLVDPNVILKIVSPAGVQLRATPLTLAVMSDLPGVINRLLENPRLAPNTADSTGFTPLMMAVFMGNLPAVRRLLQDRRVLAGINLENYRKLTALDLAQAKKNQKPWDEIARLLSQHEARKSEAEVRKPQEIPE